MMSYMTFALISQLAVAQEITVPEVDGQPLRLSLDSTRTFLVDDTSDLPTRAFARLVTSYSHAPLMYRSLASDPVAVIGSVTRSDVLAGYQYDRVRFGVGVPVVWAAPSDLSASTAAVGDMALEARVVALPRTQQRPGIAVQSRLKLPTATGTAPIGSPGLGAEFSVVGDMGLGPMLVAANVGTVLAPEAEFENVLLDDSLLTRFALATDVSDTVGAAAELSADLAYSAVLSNSAAHRVEWLLSGWGRIADDLVLRAGAGTSLTGAVGSPSLRTLVAIGYEPAAETTPRDMDGDGIVDGDDLCPADAEDLDSFEDTDGCPELDNDQDGVVDTSDACPMVPEDLDTWRDADGCPDPEVQLTVRVVDPDGEAIDLAKVTADIGGSPKAGKAPWVVTLDAAQDVALAVKAPGFVPTEDTISVPTGAPFVHTIALEATQIVVTRERIDLKESVYFDTGRFTIKPASFPLLDQVASVLLEVPQITRLRIEGHTDSRGSASSNQRLSDGRAKAVLEYLVAKGVAADRLVSAGFGESKPLDDREVAEAWEKNRRVDLVVEEWTD